MTQILQLAINGLLLGSVYGLLGLGMTIIFGIVGLTNLVHGEAVIIGAYGATIISQALGADPLLTLLITVPVMFLMGYLLQWGLINPAMKRSREVALLVTFGVSIILQDALLMLFTSDARHMETGLKTAVLHIGALDISLLNLEICLISVIATGLLALFLNYTYVGKAIRAISDDPLAAGLSGINVRRIYAVAMGAAMASAAVSGLCVGMKWTFYPSSGNQYLLISFIVVVLGGMGSIPGTMIGGLLVGLAQVIGGASYGLVISYVMLIILLALRRGGKG